MSPVNAFQTAACGFAISRLSRWVADVIGVSVCFLGIFFSRGVNRYRHRQSDRPGQRRAAISAKRRRCYSESPAKRAGKSLMILEPGLERDLEDGAPRRKKH